MESRCLLAANVVINEIHYNPANDPSTDAKIPNDFVELYNAGTDAANLAGWTFSKWWFAQSPMNAAGGITRSGTTATVALPGHGYTVGDSVRISGATQSQYNGVFTVTAVTTDSFSYTVAGTPVTPATGMILSQKDVKKITGFTATGTAATATLANHGYAVGDSIIIRDMGTATHYEQLITIASITANAFTFALPDVTTPWSTSVLTAQKAQQTMPDLTLATSGYLVLALDAYGFRATYPTVTSLMDAWTGGLSNDGEKVQLNDASGLLVDKVSYRSEYPWPVGANGDGCSMELINSSLDNDLGGSWRTDTKRVTTLTAAGSVATVTLANHGYAVGDKVRISGAAQPAYNGFFTVTAATATTFTYAMSSSPGTAGTGLILAQRVGGTPGRQNSVYATNAPPQTRQVDVSPNIPTTSQPATITIKATDPDGVASVSLQYQVVLPGQYIPAYLPVPVGTLQGNPALRPTLNPAYTNAASWTTVAMHDDGANGDAVAGDSIWTVVLPAQTANRTLVRYRITVADALGASAAVPYTDDPALNFAYYVYNGVPGYQGWSAEVMNSLPVYSVIVRQQDWQEMMGWNGANQIPKGNLARQVENWYGTLVYDGVVYDNISYRTRGANGRYAGGNTKRSMVYRFNNGNHFQAYDAQGNAYANKWESLVTAKGFDNRMTLTWGVNEVLSYYLFNQYNVPAPNTHFFQLRVVEGAQEAPDAFHGDFWGIEMAQENYDVRFLDEHGLAAGNLYKLTDETDNAKEQQRYQAPYAVTNGSDETNIQNSLNGGQSTATINAWVNMDEWFRWHAIVEAVQDYDFWPTANKNMAWYFEPDYSAANGNYGSQWTLPYDTDATWGPTWNSGQDVVYAAVFTAHPEFYPAYYAAIREVRDIMWQPDQINALIDHVTAQIASLGAADFYRWNNAPSDAGNYGGLTGAGKSGFAAYVQDLKNYAFVGGSWPDRSQPVGGRGAFLDTLQAANGESGLIPGTPTISYAGAAGYPVNGLALRTTAFSDPQGAGTFQAIQWRLATYAKRTAPGYDPDAPFKLEFDADWDSGRLTTFNNTITIPDGAVTPGVWYRARVRMQDSTGRWSHWSAPLEFTVTSLETVPLHDFLRITELNYHPAPATQADIGYDPNAVGASSDDFEFIELTNTSTTATLNLATVKFSAGVTFDFGTAAFSMAPGERVVLVRNQLAFRARYGSEPRIAGVYAGSLDNAGERITLADKYSVPIADFTYSDTGAWPGRADGQGSTLEVISTGGDYNDPSNWRSSTEYNGTPGRAGAGPASSVLINEVLAHTDPPLYDSIELYNPTAGPIDLGGWYLSDSTSNYKKFRIPNGTVLPAGQYAVFDGTSFDAVPFASATEGLGGTWLAEDTGATIHLTGNGWKRIQLPQPITASTALEFDFKSTVGGDIQGIGVATGDTLDYSSIFRLAGAQAQGRSEYADYTGADWKHYTIPLAEFAAAGMTGLVFANDADDVNSSTAQCFFRNVSVREEGASGEALNFSNFFGLNAAHGDDVYLVQADASGNLVAFTDHVDFGAMANGEAYGRWQDDTGNWHFYPLRQRTLGSANDTAGNGPRVGPLVISEVVYAPKMYNASATPPVPLSPGEISAGFTSLDQMEYIEIYNPTSSAVSLAHWTLGGGVSYAFADTATLPARTAMLVVSFDPSVSAMLTQFRYTARYNFGTTVKVVGPYAGHLSDIGDTVKLVRPDTPPVDEPGFYPGLLEDEASYVSTMGASSDGKSLSRMAIDSWGLNQGSWAAGATSAGVYGQVAGRYVFYNNSTLDGKTTGAGASDDNAIAADKQALLPGQAASFANYTSYARGLNGVMVDFLGGSGITSSDFTFRVGNDNNLSGWTTLSSTTVPAAPAVATRTLADGTTRVTIYWSDDTKAPKNQWLEVKVGTGARTGLPVADVFYFGNAIGETGNNSTGPAADTVVDAADEAAVRTHNTATPATADNAYDFNRDRRVNALDELLARANYRAGVDALMLLHLGQAEAAASGASLSLTAAAAPAMAAMPTSADSNEDSVPSAHVAGPATPWERSTAPRSPFAGDGPDGPIQAPLVHTLSTDAASGTGLLAQDEHHEVRSPGQGVLSDGLALPFRRAAVHNAAAAPRGVAPPWGQLAWLRDVQPAIGRKRSSAEGDAARHAVERVLMFWR